MTTIIHGDKNSLFLPEGSEKTVKFLSDTNGANQIQRKIMPGYSHLDSIIGKNAYLDIFPYILSELNKHNN
jgi:cholesterol oxidase